jgi:hypothetical protein
MGRLMELFNECSVLALNVVRGNDKRSLTTAE